MQWGEKLFDGASSTLAQAFSQDCFWKKFKPGCLIETVR